MVNQYDNKFKMASIYLMHLVECGLKDNNAKCKPDDITWELIYRLAQKNSIEGVSFYGVETIRDTVPSHIYNSWKKERDRTCVHVLSFEEERKAIIEKLKENNISVLCLKGIILNQYYPKPGMRSMVDNDIMYGMLEKNDCNQWQIKGHTLDEQNENIKIAQKKVQNVMSERGYKVVSLIGNHDLYTKAPFYNFEMHKKLVSKTSQFYSYYANAWSKSKQVKDNSNLFEFSIEEEYIYIIVHAFKHFDQSGFGVKILIDLYVYLNSLKNKMDFTYIDKQLNLLGIKDFELSIRNLAENIFDSKRDLTLVEENLLYYMVSCGTYGNVKTRVCNDLRKLKKSGKSDIQIKLQYIWNRVFFPAGIYSNYPIVEKYKILIPILPFYRITKGVIKYRKMLLEEIKELCKKH